jgi:hypothetical protein
MFDNFEQIQIDTSGATIHLVKKGDRFPLLLLHGYPQTHLIWRDISPWLKPGASSSRGEAFLLRRKLACTVPLVVALTFSSIGVTFPEPQGSFSI